MLNCSVSFMDKVTGVGRLLWLFASRLRSCPPTGTEESGGLDDEVDAGVRWASPWTPETCRRRDRIAENRYEARLGAAGQ